MNLYKILQEMQEEFMADPENTTFLSNMDKLKVEIDVFETEDAKKSAFRCKQNWFLRGERSSAYFFGLEKRNFIRRTMYSARRADGSLTKDYAEILNLQYDYYSELYSSDPNIRFALRNTSGIMLSEEERTRMEIPLSIEELYDAAMTLKSGKTPGCDGLSIELFCKFWKGLRGPLHEMYGMAIQIGKLSHSTKRGIVNIILKKNKDETWIKNWRPITLLNNDYKIIAKALANWLEGVVDTLIGPQQCGFIKNRNIQSNLARTMEVVSYTMKKGQAGVITIIDFEKCFDHIEFDSILGSFRYFGFGEEFIQNIVLLYQDFELCVENNGYISPFIGKGWRTNQGCPCSPLNYIICGELMAHLIKENSSIKGISMYGLENILSQFADDTSAYLKYEKETLEEFGKTMQTV